MELGPDVSCELLVSITTVQMTTLSVGGNVYNFKLDIQDAMKKQPCESQRGGATILLPIEPPPRVVYTDFVYNT